MQMAEILAPLRQCGDTGLARTPQWSTDISQLHGDAMTTLAANVGETTLYEFVAQRNVGADAAVDT